jgi:ABC-2 type transport system permease protein
MSDLLRLLGYSLRRVRVMVISMAALLVCFQVILILVAKSIQSSNAFGQIEALMPAFVRELMGPSVTSMMSFTGMVCLGYFHVAVMSSLVAVSIAIATVPTSEVENGFVDLILSRSIARHWIITRSIVVSVLCTIGLLGAMMAGTWAGLYFLAPAVAGWPSATLVTSLAVNLGLLMLCWAAVAMAIGSVSRRRSTATGIVGLAALAGFLLDYVARVWKPAEPVARLSPFRYYNPFDLLVGIPVPAWNLEVLTMSALVGFALAYVFFSRRDISH